MCLTNFGLNILRPQKSLVTKNFWVEKNLGSEKKGGLPNFLGWKKMLGQKNFLVKKISGQKIISSSKKFFGFGFKTILCPKNFFRAQKILVQKKCRVIILVEKHFLSKTNLAFKKLLGAHKLLDQKNRSQVKFSVKKEC